MTAEELGSSSADLVALVRACERLTNEYQQVVDRLGSAVASVEALALLDGRRDGDEVGIDHDEVDHATQTLKHITAALHAELVNRRGDNSE